MQRIGDIYWASKYGLSWWVKKLLKKKPGLVNIRDKKGRTPLEYAAEHGHKAVCELLLTYGAHIEGAEIPPLSWAALKGRVRVVELLLKHRVKVNATTSGLKETSLHMAVQHGHYDVARLLVETGANVTMRNALGMTPLDEALGLEGTFGRLSCRPKDQRMIEILTMKEEKLHHLRDTSSSGKQCTSCGARLVSPIGYDEFNPYGFKKGIQVGMDFSSTSIGISARVPQPGFQCTSCGVTFCRSCIFEKTKTNNVVCLRCGGRVIPLDK